MTNIKSLKECKVLVTPTSFARYNKELAKKLEGLVGEVNTELTPFIDAMEEVGLDLIGASDSLATATDNFSQTMNRNLKMAERISMNGLGTGQVINIDLAGANLGGMSEANIVNSLNKAVAMSNIVKVGVR